MDKRSFMFAKVKEYQRMFNLVCVYEITINFQYQTVHASSVFITFFCPLLYIVRNIVTSTLYYHKNCCTV